MSVKTIIREKLPKLKRKTQNCNFPAEFWERKKGKFKIKNFIRSVQFGEGRQSKSKGEKGSFN